MAKVALEAMNAELRPDETILAHVWANHEIAKHQIALGAIAVTNVRIRYLGSMATLLADRSFLLETISSIDLSNTRLLCKLQISADGASSVFGVRNSERLSRWVQLANLARLQAQQQLPASAQPTGPEPPTEQPPPGWYIDPQGVAARRWWEGAAWTEHAK